MGSLAFILLTTKSSSNNLQQHFKPHYLFSVYVDYMVSSLIFQISLYKAFLKSDLKIPKQFANDQMYGSLEVEA